MSSMEHVLTLGQFRAATADLPDDMPLVLSSDSEGNSYRTVSGVEEAMYLPDSTWDGDVYPTPEQAAEAVYLDPDDAIIPEDAVRVVLVVPVN